MDPTRSNMWLHPPAAERGSGIFMDSEVGRRGRAAIVRPTRIREDETPP